MNKTRKPATPQRQEPMTPDEVERVNATLRLSGLGYQIEPGGSFDPVAFTDAAMKRWPKVMARLHEAERTGCSERSSRSD